MNQSRASWIDNLRTLGIFLVVAGHTHLQEEARCWLRSFNMPLFLMISGFLIPSGGMNVGLREFFVRRMWPFIKLYLYFSIVSLVAYLYVFRDEGSVLNLAIERIRVIAYSTGSTGTRADVYPIALWFFPCLITARLLMYFIWKIPVIGIRIAGFAALAAAGFCLWGKAWPWELESALVAAGFLAAGHGVRCGGWDVKLAALGRSYWWIAGGCLGFGSIFALMNTECFDIRSLAVGNPFFAALATAMLCTGLPMLAMRLPHFRIAGIVSAATILIFPLHLLLFPYVDRFASRFGISTEEASWYGWAKAFCVVALLTSVHFVYSEIRAALLAERREARAQRIVAAFRLRTRAGLDLLRHEFGRASELLRHTGAAAMDRLAETRKGHKHA